LALAARLNGFTTTNKVIDEKGKRKEKFKKFGFHCQSPDREGKVRIKQNQRTVPAVFDRTWTFNSTLGPLVQ